MRAWLGVVLLLVTACTSALKEPPPVAAIGAPAPVAGGVAAIADAEALFARRPDHASVARARETFLALARADDAGGKGLLGAMRATSWLVEHEDDAARREALATEAVQLGQWCQRRAPAEPECDYRLALAVGQQARERPATAVDGLKVMIPLLERVAERAPDLDAAGPDRVLALVLLRAPGWPAGPGDPEAALERARRAAARAPDHPPNHLVLAEALAVSGRNEEAREAYRRALALAQRLAAAGNPDGSEWAAEAERATPPD
jgi:tetratricopeptide (TPR) repeat protein